MQIYCRQCGKEIQADGVNLDKMIAKCSACNAVFSFADMYDGEHSHQKKKQHLQYDVPMPDKFSIRDDGDTLTIERKWFSWGVIFVGIFAIIWNAVLWIFFVPNFSEVGSMFTLFLLPFIGAGIFLIYTSIAGLLNTTSITVRSKQLKISHYPLPFPGYTVSIGDIEQLFTKQRISRTKNGTRIYYQLYVLLGDGREKALLKDLPTPEQALYVEQEVERFLDIEDIPVSGEFRS